MEILDFLMILWRWKYYYKKSYDILNLKENNYFPNLRNRF